MKKRILSIILLMIVSFMMFNTNIHADTTMAIGCDLESPTPEEREAYKEAIESAVGIKIIGSIFDKLYTREYTGEKVFFRLTDNNGTVFMAPNDVNLALKTIPQISWAGQNNVLNNFDKKMCPKSALKFNGPDTVGYFDLYFLFGQTDNKGIFELDNPRFVIYEFYSEKRNDICNYIIENNIIDKVPAFGKLTISNMCKRLIVAETYNDKGAYGFIGPDLEAMIADEVTKHQLNLINNEKIKGNYFKIDETDTYGTQILIGGNYPMDKLYETWYENYFDTLTSILTTGILNNLEAPMKSSFEIRILYASDGTGRNNLKKKINEWYVNNSNGLSGYNDIEDVLNDDDFVEECDSINNAIIEGNKFNINLNEVSTLVNKLNNAQKALEKAYSVEFTDCGTGYNTSATSSITSCVVYSETLGINEITDLAYKNNDEHMVNKGFIIEALYNETNEILNEILDASESKINKIDASADLNKYTEKFYTVIAYLRSKANNSSSELEEYKEQINDIYDNYKEMVERHELNIYPVVDCETLLGEELIDKINSYLNIFKIAVPIIVIGFGIVDFTKAVFAGEEEMKKAQKAFVKRLFIALLIFLIPTVVNLILYLANKVWPIISTDSCGLF